MCFAGYEQCWILTRYQYFACNSKTRWQLSLNSERHQNGKYDTFVPTELSVNIISMRWNRYMNFEAYTSAHPLRHDCLHNYSLKILCCPHDCDRIFSKKKVVSLLFKLSNSAYIQNTHEYLEVA